ncbi:hypothetical protein GI374_06825 [Paracoccus sp. S-4012]|uniref:hypothetical protein n=1 Tax=Paracoccus sp. S-4012 TaxID=2665648 RepID=UPI0012B0C2BF|nr:hypothetical protein [Paracoccus sp. S-4012]MRX50167.1 hypothetical protein [Paracoccus sp. S-4012]
MPTEPARRTASRNTTILLVGLGIIAIILLVAWWLLADSPDAPVMQDARETPPAAVPEAQTGAAVDPVPEGTTPAAE